MPAMPTGDSTTGMASFWPNSSVSKLSLETSFSTRWRRIRSFRSPVLAASVCLGVGAAVDVVEQRRAGDAAQLAVVADVGRDHGTRPFGAGALVEAGGVQSKAISSVRWLLEKLSSLIR